MYRVLLIYPGSTPPKSDPGSNMEYHLSKYCQGDVLSTHWGVRDDLPKIPLAEIYRTHLGSFRYHATFSAKLPKFVRFFWDLSYFIRTGLWLSFTQGRYQAIVTYGPYTCGMAGWVVRAFTRSRLIIMMPAPPVETFKYVKTFLGKIKYQFARLIIPALIRSADAAWLLYPTQLDDLPGRKMTRVHVFPDFTPTTEIASIAEPQDRAVNPYLLFLGYPFQRKGVDLLIEAFLAITDAHPEFVLKVVGHCPDLTPYRKLAGDHPRILFERPVLHDEAIRLIVGCHLFILPSRLEGVPRVVVEAMAIGRPVIASRINGTPTILEDGRDGLLFESENVEELAERMDRLLSDPQLAYRLGEAAKHRIAHDFSSETFAIRFRDMIRDVVGDHAISA